MISGMIFVFIFSPKRMIFHHHIRQIQQYAYLDCLLACIIYVLQGEIFLL